MEAYFEYKKYLFKCPKNMKVNQKEIIEEMAFRESDSAEQLNEKNKQIYKYLGSIREYNYSNL